MVNRSQLKSCRRWVVKIGSSLVTADGRGLDLKAIEHWGHQLAEMRQSGCDIVLVSSGSIAEGMSRLGWAERPQTVHELQAAAAIGQMGLVQAYESAFKSHGVGTAQILLTHDDMANRRRYLNARSTLNTLLELGTIPVINENDTVTTDESKLGDNDTLASLVANLISADILVILTDQEGMYDADPRTSPDANLIPHGSAEDTTLLELATATGGRFGSGGMRTKLLAAQRAALSGTSTVIASGRLDNVLQRLRDGDALGTLLEASSEPLLARKQWLANQLKVSGQVTIDAGARRVLVENNRSLLAVGVVAVSGEFKRGELVSCIDTENREVARGLINYSADEVDLLKQQPSNRIEAILGYRNEPELIDRDNLVITCR
ncbi:MAG: glutamate 5-kinase [Pseudomonadota bacterium]